MPEFFCPRCEYATTRRANMVKHINRKRICLLNGVDLIPKQYEKLILSGDFKILMFIVNLKKESIRLKEENNTLKKENNTLRESKGRNTTNNISTGDNCVINNITVQIKPYDKNNDYEHLTDKDYIHCIQKMKYSVPALLKLTHFNRYYPQYKNVNISNMRGKFANIFNGENWEIAEQKAIIDDIFISHQDLIREWSENNEDERYLKKVEKILDMYEEKDVVNEIKERIRTMLYNGRQN